MPTSRGSVLKVNQNITNTPEKKGPKYCIKRSNSEKIKAARKLGKELDAEAENKEDKQRFVFGGATEHHEKIMGALALMELAGASSIPAKMEIDSDHTSDMSSDHTYFPY